MMLKRLAQILLISCGAIALAACSAHKRASDEVNVADANGGGAQTSMVSDNSSFGNNGAEGDENSANKRTYHFAFDKSDVRDEDRPAVMANGDYLVAHPRTKVMVEGHTDPRGSREYNVALGERRANSVADIMKSRGASAGEMRIVSYGAERPAAVGHTESDYQMDRRAVLVYR